MMHPTVNEECAVYGKKFAAPNKLVELQHKFDELESLGIFSPLKTLA
jgi:hypothetical protein